MAERICLNDGNPIPLNRRSDAIFCCNKCGWEYRNKLDNEANKDKKLHERKLHMNHKILQKLESKGKFDVPIEAMELMDFDFDYCTGVENVDKINSITEYHLYEYIIITDNFRCKFKKRTS